MKNDKGNADADSRRLLNFIREEPLVSAGAAAAAGFVIGGGLAGDLGLALAGILARTAFRRIANDLICGNQKQRGASAPAAHTARDI